MGCTSSAPNMNPQETNTENNVKLSEEESDESKMETMGVSETSEVINDYDEKEDDAIGKMVLPTCDNIDETLARNISLVDAPSLDLEDFPEKNENGQTESELSNITLATENVTNEVPDPEIVLQTPESPGTMEVEEKLSTLEEVVEKVVEYYVTDKLDTLDSSQQQLSTESRQNDDLGDSQLSSDARVTADEERAPSPSQSASSRATRWEALADVAAELPPSLTVDPVTGQIYSLSK